MRVLLVFASLIASLLTLLTVALRDSVFSRESDVFYQHLVYTKDRQLYHVDLISGATTRPWPLELDYRQMYWSAQGQRYLFAFDTTLARQQSELGVGLVSANTRGAVGQATVLFGREDATAAAVSRLFQSNSPYLGDLMLTSEPDTNLWSPDGEWIAFVDKTPNNPNATLYRVRHDGSDKLELVAGMVTTANPIFNTWSPDSQWVIFTLDSDIFRISVDAGRMEPLTAMEGQEEFLGVSADRQWLYFEATRPQSPGINYGLYRMRFDGGDMQLLSTDRMGFMGESPDGEWLYRYDILSSGGYTLERLNLRTLEEQFVADDLSSNVFAAWTPDDEWLIVPILDRRGQMRLTKLSVSTNQPIPLGTPRETIDILTIAPNSEWLFFRGSIANPGQVNGYEAVNLTTGQTIQYAGLLPQDSQLLAWSPDSRWLIVEETVVQNNEVKWRLARMRVDGSQHKALTDYSSNLQFLGWWRIPIADFDPLLPIIVGLILFILGLLGFVRAKRRFKIP